jgi:hypothetical protein
MKRLRRKILNVSIGVMISLFQSQRNQRNQRIQRNPRNQRELRRQRSQILNVDLIKTTLIIKIRIEVLF